MKLLGRLLSDLLGKADPRLSEPGWATVSLDQSLRRAFMLGAVVGFPLVGILLIASAPDSRVYWAATGLGILATVLAAEVLRKDRIPVAAVLVAAGPVGPLIYIGAAELNSVVTLAACWVVNVVSIAAVLVLRGRAGFVYAIVHGFVGGAAIYLAHPEWDPQLAGAVPVTQIAIAFAGRFAIIYLLSFASQADAESEKAARSHEAVMVAESASRSAAESARLMHDTIINTLGVIAGGGKFIERSELVRERCHRDIEVVKSVLDAGITPPPTSSDLMSEIATLAVPIGVNVRRATMSDDDRAHLPDEVRQVIVRAIHEVLLNAAKHSGTAEVVVSIRQAGGSHRISIRDDGIGFDTRATTGFGLAESVIARCRDYGVDVVFESAPGAGTLVTFSYRPPKTTSGEDDGFAATVESTKQRALWMWSASVVGVGVWIEATNRFGEFGMTWAMLAVVAAAGALAWFKTRGGRRLSTSMQVLLIVSAPVAFILSFAGVAFGEHDLVLIQLYGATVAPLILLFNSTSIRSFIWSNIAITVAGAGLALWMLSTGSDYAGAVAIGWVVVVLTIGGFQQFHSAMDRIGAQTVAEQQAAEADRRRLAARQAADRARDRWRVSGLQHSVELLEKIAHGGVVLTNPQVREGCSREERYLRQLLMLSPDLLNMGYWLSRAAAAARERNIRLALRADDFDIADEEAACSIGELILDEIGRAPAGSALTVGLFRTSEGGSVVVVGEGTRDSEISLDGAEDLRVSSQQLGGQHLIEVSWSG